MESLNDWIQNPSSEVIVNSEDTSAPHVVSFILGLLKSNPSLFVFGDLSNRPSPGKNWHTFGETDTGKRLTVSISSDIANAEIQIRVRDGNLQPGKPMFSGEFGYRVNIFARRAAESYKKSVGFETSNPSFVFKDLDMEVIISDNWAETITEPEEIIRLLSDARFSTSRPTTKT